MNKKIVRIYRQEQGTNLGEKDTNNSGFNLNTLRRMAIALVIFVVIIIACLCRK